MTKIAAWVREELGGTKLGDTRRDERFLRLVAAASVNPHGRVSEAIPAGAERQAAYDFLEHDSVRADDVAKAVSRGTARQSAKHAEILVALDGSSLALRDSQGINGFGSVGARAKGAVGLKVVTALALELTGKLVGVVSQKWWARTEPAPKKSKTRALAKRESQHWHDAVDRATDSAREIAPRTRLHFLVDREGDASLLMQRLKDAGHAFTIRANGTRKVLNARGRRVNVRKFLRRAPGTTHQLKLRASAKRKGRTATLTTRFATVQLIMRDRHTHKRELMSVSVVWAREEGVREPLDWLLYTTAPVMSAEQARETLERYTHRWQVEEFHRAWKRGGCEVEETQLRSKDAVIKWATVLAVVAVRSEKLKLAARETPEAAASQHFSAEELEAIVLLKREEKRRNETVDDEPPNLATAVRWLADLGGYIGKSNGPPGATVIGRGLVRIAPIVKVLPALRAAQKR